MGNLALLIMLRECDIQNAYLIGLILLELHLEYGTALSFLGLAADP